MSIIFVKIFDHRSNLIIWSCDCWFVKWNASVRGTFLLISALIRVCPAICYLPILENKRTSNGTTDHPPTTPRKWRSCPSYCCSPACWVSVQHSCCFGDCPELIEPFLMVGHYQPLEISTLTKEMKALSWNIFKYFIELVCNTFGSIFSKRKRKKLFTAVME